MTRWASGDTVVQNGLVRQSPAVAIARKPRLKYFALPGFMDADLENLIQILLITPDGREWKTKNEI